MANNLIQIQSDGRMQLNFHPGQGRAWKSDRRFVCVLAGTQGGKTSLGPHWLYREIQSCGPGDYLVATPTFPLLELKALPEFKRLFETYLRLGRYIGHPIRKFTFSEDGQQRTFGGHGHNFETTVYFGHAMDPDSLEAATIKAAWCDEVGQKKFRLSSWEAILRRLSLSQGRVLLTTTPYNLGWLKQQLWDKWRAGDKTIDVIRFESIENPLFPLAEFERARATLPRWKFDMFYRAIFSRPAGLIYDNFDEVQHECPRFPIPLDWPRYLGLDFGGVNTVGLFYALEPNTDRYYLYREYRASGRTAEQHTEKLLAGEPGIPICWGGSGSEDQWREEFAAGGLPVRGPKVTEVEVGIDRVYGCHNSAKIIVFDDLSGYLDEKLSYSRELDEMGDPTEKIEDKSSYHFMDAERYFVCGITGNVDAVGEVVDDIPAETYKSERRSLWQ